ncbi:MAG: NAD(P)/FAD-dependent oxidoreductase [Candidatus Thorarchaeota archaeon]
MPKNYVIIGGGPAGANAAEKLRELEPSAEITLISDENYTYYKRSKIINLISNSCTEEDLFLKGNNFYEKLRINFKNGYVKKVNPNNNQIVLEDNSTLNYDSLLIASGGTPLILPWEGVNLKGISTLYSLKDAKEVAKNICKAKHAVIIGGGSIAIKAVKNFIKAGLKVSIIEKSSHLWPIGFDRKISRIFEREFIDRGADLYFNDEVVRFNGENGEVRSVTLKSSQEIPAELVVITIGIRPNIDFIKDTNIKIDKGIIVDNHLVTNISNIFAAGDVAQTEDPLYQSPILHPTWGNAKKQGKIAAENMVGNSIEYKGTIPIQTIKGFDFQAIAAGITHSKKSFDEISWVSFQESFCRKFVLDKDNLIGVLILGRNIDKKQLKPLIKKAVFNKSNISDYKTDILKEGFDFNKILSNTN